MSKYGKLRLVVFDLAGTILDDAVTIKPSDSSDGTTVPLVVAAIKAAFDEHDLAVPISSIHKLRGLDKREAIKILIEEHESVCLTERVEQVYAAFVKQLELHVREMKTEITGTLELFQLIQEQHGIFIAVGSGFPDIMVKQLVYQMPGWSQWIDYVSSAEKEGSGRPNPALVLSAMKACGISDPRHVLKVGDTVADIEEGHNAGVWTVAVRTGTQSLERLQQAEPDDIIGSVADLPSILDWKRDTTAIQPRAFYSEPGMSPRVRLGHLQYSDIPAVMLFLGDADVQRFKLVTTCDALTLIEGKQWLFKAVRAQEAQLQVPDAKVDITIEMAIIVKSELVGTISLERVTVFGKKPTQEMTVKYMLRKSHWNQGLASEALQLAVSVVEKRWPLVTALRAHVVKQNSASLRVLARCGFVKTGATSYSLNGENRSIVSFVRWVGSGKPPRKAKQPTMKARSKKSQLRWRLLRKRLLRETASGEESQASVHRMQGLYAMYTSRVLSEVPESCATLLAAAQREEKAEDKASFQLLVYHDDNMNADYFVRIRVENTVTLTEMAVAQESKVDNTGNICVWPSEQVLAWYVCRHEAESFSGKRVMELGAGMTGLAGLVIARTCGTAAMHLTDGNPLAAKSLALNARLNNDTGVVTAATLRWDRNHEYEPRYDFVIAADVVFFKDYHVDLLAVLAGSLVPGGVALLMGPRRGNTLDLFSQLVRSQTPAVFEIDVIEQYDDEIWRRHQSALAKEEDADSYDPQLHFPLLVRLTKSI